MSASMNDDVPRALRWMTLAHAVLDAPFGAVLLASPALALSAAGITAPDPLFARIYGAALLGVALVSVRVRNEGRAAYRVVLFHKVAWAGCAMVACTLAALGGAPRVAWFFAGTFFVFASAWSYWLVRLRST